MNDVEILTLRNAVSSGPVVWIPDTQTAHQVLRVGKHAEEGDELCAIFSHGFYAVLYNAELKHFYCVKSLDNSVNETHAR